MAKTTFNPRDDFQVAAAIGLFEGVTGLADFAQELDLQADTPTILGTGSGDILLPPDTGEEIEIVSSDIANGGAEIRMEVLDVAFAPKIVTVSIPAAVGAVPVLDPETGDPMVITRINAAVNIGPRGTGELVGDLIIRSVATPANEYGVITAEAQELQQAVRTIPAGYDSVITSLTASMRKSAGADTDVSLALYGAPVGRVFRQVFAFGLQRSGGTNIEFVNFSLESSTGPTDLYLVAESSASGAAVAARLTVTLINK